MSKANKLQKPELMKILLTSGPQGDVGKTSLCKNGIRPGLLHHYNKVAFDAIEDKAREAHGNGEGSFFKAKSASNVLSALDFVEIGEASILEIGSGDFKNVTAVLMGSDKPLSVFHKIIMPLKETLKPVITINTLETLIELGADPSNIYIVFNAIDVLNIADGYFEESLGTTLKKLIDAAQEMGVNLCPTPIADSDLFKELTENSDFIGYNIRGINALDKGHFHELALKAKSKGDMEEFAKMAKLHAMRKQSEAVVRDLDDVFEFCFPELVS